MSNYKLAIFDLDGTLLDTLGDLADSVNHSLRTFGYPERSVDEVKSFVGNGIRNLIERAVPEGTPSQDIDRVFCEFDSHYKSNSSYKTKPYDGILTLLDNLKKRGIKLAVVSNKVHSAVVDLCEKYFGSCFDIVFGERVGIAKKPSAVAINEILDILSIDGKSAVYIGDSEVDIFTAKNADMDLILVTWGFRDKLLLDSYGGSNYADNTCQLEAMILS